MDTESQLRFELVKHEMDTVQAGIRAYSQVQFTIKGWAITIFSGFAYFAVKEGQPTFLSLGALAVILFWILDATFKSIQEVYIQRATTIEHFLQALDVTQGGQLFKDFRAPNIESMFEQLTGWSKAKAVWHAALLIQLALLYVVMLIIIGVLIVYRH